MYGYNKYIPLRTNEILKRVNEEDIFKIAIQDEIVLDKGLFYTAPYRTDNNPGCYFEMYDGELMFIDFANVGIKSMNCFTFIQKVYNTDFKTALEIINTKLSLGLGGSYGTEEIEPSLAPVEEKSVKRTLKERTITLLPRPFGYKDKQFWSKYEISKQNLIEDGVIPIELYKSTNKFGKHFSIRPFDICYAYTKFVDIQGKPIKGKVKVYRPHSKKGEKWFTNCNQDNIGSLETLPKKGEILIISKSYKDCRVLRNQGLNSVWFQNEGMIPNKEILLNLAKRFKKMVVWFDNDNVGITHGIIIRDHINSFKLSKTKSIFLPPKLLLENIKDPSDLLKKKGKKVLKSFLLKNDLILS